VYVLDDQVHLLRLADGRDTTIGPGTYARFMNAGLVYADGARIHLVPYEQLVGCINSAGPARAVASASPV
jgi:hypothetical protein